MNISKSTLAVAGCLSLAILTLPMAFPKAAHALAATLVQVTNTASNPVISQDVDSPARSPYYKSVTCYSASSNQCAAQFPVVPANKRLVVQQFFGSVDTPTSLSVGEFVQGDSILIPILFTYQGPDPANNKIYVANQPILYYFEAGQAPSFSMNAASGPFVFMSGSVTLTGYMVDLTQ